jgi:co-chaperonin GroES (HSP10)
MHRSVRDKLLVKMDEAPDLSEIIEISPQFKDKATTGTVISVGKLVDEIAVGDRVGFSKFAGFQTFIEGVEHRTLKQDDVMVLLDPSMPALEINFHTDRKKSPAKRDSNIIVTRGMVPTIN